jgi:hypothetical protein
MTVGGSPRSAVPVRVEVNPSCGHGWTETRPAGTVLPVDGELRVCGHSGCYPAEWPVTYTNLTELDPDTGEPQDRRGD